MLREDERDAALGDLPGWTFDAGRNGIAKSFRFADFGAASSCRPTAKAA